MTLVNHMPSRLSLIAGISEWYLKADDVSYWIAERGGSLIYGME